MAVRRKVDVSKLAGLVQVAQNQEVSKGNKKTDDPNFPLFTTPVNEDILVYIPKTNMISTENGDEMGVLRAHIHDYKTGKQYGQFRCISNLVGPGFEDLGYDGSCPACEAVRECWDLYNKKLETEAQKLGMASPQDDTNDILKPFKDKFRDEMELRGAEEYVTFPIVKVPMEGKMTPSKNAMNELQPVFVTWRKKRYEDSIISALEGLMDNPGHPAGMFWMWKFSYNTEGKQATARDSAKNAKYMPLEQGLQKFGQALADACENASKDFTLVKATEVLVANQFMFKEDLEAEVNRVMAKTRNMLELTGGGVVAPALGGATQTTPVLGDGVNPLMNFSSENVSLGLDNN